MADGCIVSFINDRFDTVISLLLPVLTCTLTFLPNIVRNSPQCNRSAKD